MITVLDFTEWRIGEPLAHTNGRVEACPACGRPAWAQRYTPYAGRYPAHFVHRVFMDEETLTKTYERCMVEDAPRFDGLTHVEAAELEAWANALEGHCRLLKATLGLGWYQEVPDGRDVAYYVAQLGAALAAAPAITTEAGHGR